MQPSITSSTLPRTQGALNKLTLKDLSTTCTFRDPPNLNLSIYVILGVALLIVLKITTAYFLSKRNISSTTPPVSISHPIGNNPPPQPQRLTPSHTKLSVALLQIGTSHQFATPRSTDYRQQPYKKVRICIIPY